MKVYSRLMFDDFLNQCREVEKELYKSLNACHENRRGYVISPEIIYTKAILRPAKSFYYADAKQILKAIRIHSTTSENKGSAISMRRKELIRLYEEVKKECPELKPIEIANRIDEMPAPRFYIGVSYAQAIFYKHYDSNRKND